MSRSISQALKKAQLGKVKDLSVLTDADLKKDSKLIMYQGRNYPVLFIEFKGMCIQHIKGQNCVHMYLLSVLFY